MIKTDDLFDKILLEPCKQLDCDTLRIVSGYATNSMLTRHIEKIIEKDSTSLKTIELIVGMSPLDGVSEVDHKGFIKSCQGIAGVNFSCSYIVNNPPVHAKLFCWLRQQKPLIAFIGSSNYTQRAFSSAQKEVCVHGDPIQVNNYFNDLIPNTIFCNHQEAEVFTTIFESRRVGLFGQEDLERDQVLEEGDLLLKEKYRGLERATISLVDRSGNVPEHSGLNWGHREDYNRDLNQAYLSIRGDLRLGNYFPAVKVHFTVLADDGAILTCTRAQQDGKAIHTPHGNNILGEYFRKRLGVVSGKKVEVADLQKYGRLDVIFYKIDDETFYMDFSNK